MDGRGHSAFTLTKRTCASSWTPECSVGSRIRRLALLAPTPNFHPKILPFETLAEKFTILQGNLGTLQVRYRDKTDGGEFSSALNPSVAQVGLTDSCYLLDDR